jgi:hypothetical protein
MPNTRRQETSGRQQQRPRQNERNRGNESERGFRERGEYRGDTGYEREPSNWDQQNRSAQNWDTTREGRDSRWQDNDYDFSRGRDFGGSPDYGQSRFGQGQGYDEDRSYRQSGFGSGQGWGRGQEDFDRGFGYGPQSRGWGRDSSRGFGGGDWDQDSERYGRLGGNRGEFDYESRGGESGGGGGQSRYRSHDSERYMRAGMGAESGQSRFGPRGAQQESFPGQGGMSGFQQDYRGSSSTSYGPHAGRGPQGYKRSDERVTEDINEELTQAPDIDATNITVDVKNGEVTLRGTVPERESKRRAEEIAEQTSGVKDVQNQLRVKREDESETESKRDKDRNEDRQRSKQSIAS